MGFTWQILFAALNYFGTRKDFVTKIIYTTDLHGESWKYEHLAAIARKLRPDVVINGGDMLPKNGSLFEQDKFIDGELSRHFKEFESEGIDYLCLLGNDDLRIWDDLFEETCGRYSVIHNIAQRKIKIKDMEFIGMNWVVDYPFILKDRCRMDTNDYVFQRQLGPGVLSIPGGFKTIADWFEYAKALPTIAEELENLPLPLKKDSAVYVIHMPPSGLDLDVCMSGVRAGSKAVHNFLLRNQPLLSLHGHIHESPDLSGRWKANLGKTVCIQPGQMDDFTYVTIDIESMEIMRNHDLIDLKKRKYAPKQVGRVF